MTKHDVNGSAMEEDSWKKWSSFNRAAQAEGMAYQPPPMQASKSSYNNTGQLSCEASWDV